MRHLPICKRCPSYTEYTKRVNTPAGNFDVLSCRCLFDGKFLPLRMFRAQRLPMGCDLALEQVVICFGGENEQETDGAAVGKGMPDV